MTAYYNEIDPFAAQWLRNLIDAGHISPGVVDERSIEDVNPNELSGYTQCHFFAGIGAWSLALRRAGWPDNRRIWTGSCPCQPFSASGKKSGFADERHLWPSWHWLIEECRPPVLLGEQVASKTAEPWFDLVQADLEALGYAFGCVPFPSAGVGAPHIRDRAYWVADSDDQQPQGATGDRQGFGKLGREGTACGLADSERNRLDGSRTVGSPGRGEPSDGSVGSAERPASPTNGLWRDADWLKCRDGKWRPVEPIHVKMADGSAANVGYLCSDSEEDQGRVSEILQGLREHAGAETVFQRRAGEPFYAGKTEVLRPEMHGGRSAERAVQQSKSQPHEGSDEGTKELRNVRGVRAATRSPHRRESEEQCVVKLDDVVQLLSQSSTLAKLYGDYRTEEALRILSEAILSKRAVPDASVTAQEVWASLSEEEKNRHRVGFDAAQWRVVVPTPLIKNAVGRVGRLRAYGNAINAEAATVFIQAVMEAQA